MPDQDDDLTDVWARGYSIAELWGSSKPVARADQADDNAHVILWGILSIVEYQVDKGAGHRYLRDRLWHGDWIAIGVREPKSSGLPLEIVPPIKDAKFGRKLSAIGDGQINFVDVRVVHSNRFARAEAGGRPAK